MYINYICHLANVFSGMDEEIFFMLIQMLLSLFNIIKIKKKWQPCYSCILSN